VPIRNLEILTWKESEKLPGNGVSYNGRYCFTCHSHYLRRTPGTYKCLECNLRYCRLHAVMHFEGGDRKWIPVSVFRENGVEV
jgi:hypothetical protein